MKLPGPECFAAITRFDQTVEVALGRIRGNAGADRLFFLASEAGNFSAIWHTLAWLGVLVDRRRWRRAVVVSVALGVESALVNGAIKSLFRRERPTPKEPRPHRLREPKTSSFPSGHASAAMVAAALLSRRTRSGPMYYLLGAFVALSRVYVRIHHASDVAGGAVVGVALGRIARRLPIDRFLR